MGDSNAQFNKSNKLKYQLTENIKRRIKCYEKKIFTITSSDACFCYDFSTSVIAYASDKTAPYGNIELEDAYSRIVTYANENNIELGMTYDDFRNGYAGQSISEYENSYYSVLLPSPTVATCSSSSGGGRKYYYNTGYSCPSQATYSKYNLLDVVKKEMLYTKQKGLWYYGTYRYS